MVMNMGDDMNTIEVIREFLGWCSVINISVLVLSTIMLTIMRSWIVSIHARMTGVDETDLPKIYIEYLGNYKILIFVFNIVPYLALRLMA